MPQNTVTLLGIAAGRGAPTPGAEDGPDELRHLGLIDRLERHKLEVEDLGNIVGAYESNSKHPPSGDIHNLPIVLQVNRHTHACMLGARRKHPDSFLLVIGGDHSLAIGTLAGLSDSCLRLGLLWIDAHGDFNTPASSPSGQAHGMSLAVACGHGHRELRGIADRIPLVREDDVFLFGPRELDRGEAENLRRSRVTVLSTEELRAKGIVTSVIEAARTLATRCDHLHLSFDIDVLDPDLAPGTGTRVPGGLSASEARDLLAALGRERLVGSAEFVEYNPELDPDRRTGDLAIELIEALVAGWPKFTLR